MKEFLIKKSINLICEEGVGNFTVRSLAKYSGVSTRPIYYYFKNFKNIVSEINKEVIAKLAEYTARNYTNEKFLNSGVGFVLFAKELPNYYAILSIKELWKDQTYENNDVDDLMRSKASSEEFRIYETMKIFTLGMALIASSLPERFTLEQIIMMQSELYQKIK